MPKQPTVLWAQRKDRVFISIQLDDVSGENVSLDETTLSFKGTSGKEEYEVHLEFFAAINSKDSSEPRSGREYFFDLIKVDKKAAFWPRLEKHEKKRPNIKIDFNRWKDEDEEDDTSRNYEDASMEDMMKQMGAGDMGTGETMDLGGDSDDGDSDEDLPALEPTT